MVLDLIDSLSKENWDGICKVIEVTGKAAGVVLTGYAAVEGAKALANRGKKEESINTDSITKTDIEKLIEEKYSDDNSGIELIITDGMVQFVAKKETMEYINKIFDKRTNPKLTKAAMEVLSIIAYNEDITRAEIENIRGVSSDAIIYKLIEYGLIKESGKRETLRKTYGI